MKFAEPSLLDKLFDDHPSGMDFEPVRRFSIDAYKATVGRDLEALLNSRCFISEINLSRFIECRRSLLTYGIDDFSGFGRNSSTDCQRICQAIARVITRHEPRLRDVRVALEDLPSGIGAMRISIRGLLVMRPAAEPVNFDAMLLTTTQQCVISSASSARDLSTGAVGSTGQM